MIFGSCFSINPIIRQNPRTEQLAMTVQGIDGNLVIFETRYYYYFLPSFQKKVGNTITKYLVLKNY